MILVSRALNRHTSGSILCFHVTYRFCKGVAVLQEEVDFMASIASSLPDRTDASPGMQNSPSPSRFVENMMLVCASHVINPIDGCQMISTNLRSASIVLIEARHRVIASMVCGLTGTRRNGGSDFCICRTA